MRRAIGAVLAAGLAVLAAAPARAQSPDAPITFTQTVADGSAIAFTLRPSYDAGGAAPLPVYIGYAEANAATPDPAADGQGSWYNLNLVESAAFAPPERCTPSKNVEATRGGAEDVQAWLTDYVATVTAAMQAQRQPPPPTVPGPRRPCSERFPGFAQSRFPATETIGGSATDNYLDKPFAAAACREDPSSSQCRSYEQHWPAFRGAAGRAARDGAFAARSTDAPSQESSALLIGAGDGAIVSIGVARSEARARMQDGALVTEAVSILGDVCVLAGAGGCAVHIDEVRQEARVVVRDERAPEVTARTIVAGLRGAATQDVTAEQLQLGQAAVDFGGYFRLQAVSATKLCDPATPDAATVVADAGGLVIEGKGDQGGSIQIGGACVRARLSVERFSLIVDDRSAAVPPQVIVIPGVPAPAFVLGVRSSRPAFGPPQVVTEDVVNVFYRRAIAWRTAPYWGPALAALLALGAAGYRFRRHRLVAPAARAADRFARQFLRG